RVLFRSVLPVLVDEVAGRLRDGEREEPVDHGGHGLGEEHPPPRLEAEPQLLGRAARGVGEEGVGEERGEDAEHDGQLLEGAEPAADVGGGDLGDVGGGDDRGGAHPEAAEHAPGGDGPRADGEAGADRGDREEHGGDEHDADPALPGGERAGEPGAGDAAEEGGGDREALEESADLEVRAHRVDRAVDHGGVEAEEEAAEGGREADPEDPAVERCRLSVRGAHEPLPSLVRQGTLTPSGRLGAVRGDQPPSSRSRSTTAWTPRATAGVKPASSIATIPAMVVPPGEHTMSTRSAGLTPSSARSRTIRALPSTAWAAISVASALGMPPRTAPRASASMNVKTNAGEEPAIAV